MDGYRFYDTPQYVTLTEDGLLVGLSYFSLDVVLAQDGSLVLSLIHIFCIFMHWNRWVLNSSKRTDFCQHGQKICTVPRFCLLYTSRCV